MLLVKREFLINIILLFVINLMIKPIYIFGIEAKVQDLTGLESYGLYFFYFNFIFLFQFINDPGLQSWNAQYVPKNRIGVARLLPEVFQAKLLMSIVFIALTNMVSYLLGYLDGLMIFFITLSFVLSSVFMILRGMIAGLGYYRIDSFISALDKFLLIIILGYLIYFADLKQDFDIIWFVWIQCIVYTLVSIFAAAILLSKTKVEFYFLSLRRMGFILREGAPFILIVIFMTAYNKLDGVMLGWLLDDNKFQAGVYAAAYRFYETANMGGFLFASLLLPMYAANLNQSLILNELINTGTKLTLAICLIITGTIFFFGEDILKILYSQYQPVLFLTLKILIIAYCMVAVSYIFGTYVTATGNVRSLNIVFAAGLSVNIVLGLILIPKYGALGAAINTLTTQFLVMIGQIYLVKNQLDLNPLKNDLVNIVFYGLSVISVFWLVTSISKGSWLPNMVVSILICVPLTFIFKILDKNDIRKMIREKR